MAEPDLLALARHSLDASAGVHADAVRSCSDAVVEAARLVATSIRSGGKLLVFGNGGSAADAQHLAAEFVGRFKDDRSPLAALALTTDTSALTAIGNDFGFDQVFSRQVVALGRPGDVVMAISTSGSSPNVLAGVEAARSRSMATIALTGGGDRPLARAADVAICVPSAETSRIQECHLALEHVLSECVEVLLGLASLAPVGPGPAPRVVSVDEAVLERERWRHEGKVVVWTNGCFDLLHAGHLANFRAARELGDVLVVGLNDDESVRRLKGAGRPLMPAAERAELVAALRPVDRVVVFAGLTPEAVLARLQPDIHCKGEDYAPPDGKPVPEQEVVEGYGGRVVFLPLVPARSSTELIDRLGPG